MMYIGVSAFFAILRGDRTPQNLAKFLKLTHGCPQVDRHIEIRRIINC